MASCTSCRKRTTCFCYVHKYAICENCIVTPIVTLNSSTNFSSSKSNSLSSSSSSSSTSSPSSSSSFLSLAESSDTENTSLRPISLISPSSLTTNSSNESTSRCHSNCVIGNYFDWLADGDYDWPPRCKLCQLNINVSYTANNSNSESSNATHANSEIKTKDQSEVPMRLVCKCLYHLNCIHKHLSSALNNHGLNDNPSHPPISKPKGKEAFIQLSLLDCPSCHAVFFNPSLQPKTKLRDFVENFLQSLTNSDSIIFPSSNTDLPVRGDTTSSKPASNHVEHQGQESKNSTQNNTSSGDNHDWSVTIDDKAPSGKRAKPSSSFRSSTSSTPPTRPTSVPKPVKHGKLRHTVYRCNLRRVLRGVLALIVIMTIGLYLYVSSNWKHT